MKINKNVFYLSAGAVLILLLLAADQLTKYLAQIQLAGTAGIALIPGVFELYYVENRGAAFGMLNNRQLLFIVIAAVIIVISIYTYIRLPESRHYHFLRVVCVLIASGAAGNMIDRLVRGYVTDFLYVSLIDFPVFNLADCFVCVGAALAVIALFTLYQNEDFAFLKLRSQ
ncbi:MAG: signal peptidase II [Lachnospiraceae bacterium]|nr:signal peptidase II [Lachnospiraceae bacterium]